MLLLINLVNVFEIRCNIVLELLFVVEVYLFVDDVKLVELR